MHCSCVHRNTLYVIEPRRTLLIDTAHMITCHSLFESLFSMIYLKHIKFDCIISPMISKQSYHRWHLKSTWKMFSFILYCLLTTICDFLKFKSHIETFGSWIYITMIWHFLKFMLYCLLIINHLWTLTFFSKIRHVMISILKVTIWCNIYILW